MIPMRQLNILAATLGVAVTSLSCGSAVRSGSSPMFLVVNTLLGQTGSPGGTLGSATSPLVSNVQNTVTTSPPCAPVVAPATTVSCAFVVNDGGVATFLLEPKNIGVTTPSTNNDVTLTRYHVSYARADGLNTPGVDVPYAFDGAVTATLIPGAVSSTVAFELVRIVAKEEPPLAALVSSPTVLTVIASVTFYGQDLVGNAISATGTIQIDFGMFGS
jgi:hypothetical protein